MSLATLANWCEVAKEGAALQYYDKKWCNALKVKEITGAGCKLQATSCKPKAES
jgi:hypothetical protein